MSLEDIKKTIIKEAQDKAEETISNGQKKADELQRHWLQKLEEKKAQIVASARAKTDQKVQQTQFKLQAQKQTAVLNQKKKILDKTYQQALILLKELDDQKYVNLMAKLMEQLPEVSGEIFGSVEKIDLLRKAKRQAKVKAEIRDDNSIKTGGFIFRSPQLEIDFTLPALVENSKEQTLIAVCEQLFNQTRH